MLGYEIKSRRSGKSAVDWDRNAIYIWGKDHKKELFLFMILPLQHMADEYNNILSKNIRETVTAQ